LGQPTVKIS